MCVYVVTAGERAKYEGLPMIMLLRYVTLTFSVSTSERDTMSNLMAVLL